MDVMEFITIVGYSLTIFGLGIQCGKYISEQHKNNRPSSKK